LGSLPEDYAAQLRMSLMEPALAFQAPWHFQVEGWLWEHIQV